MRRLLTITLTPALAVVLAAAALGGCGRDSNTANDEQTAVVGTPTTELDDTRRSDDALDHRTPSAGPATSAGPTTSSTPAPSATTPTPPSSTTTNQPADQPATPPTDRPATPPTTVAPQPDGPRFVCPEGGIDAVAALQRAVDQGHQPWRMSPEDVAAACTFGAVDTVEPAGADRYRVTDDATGESALVEVAQPLGAGTIWVVTSVTPG
jgi:hypothetical protein